MKNKAVIFDMDGVISDTQKYHGLVEAEIFGLYGIHTISPGSEQLITPERIGQNFAGIQPGIWMKKIFDVHGKSDYFDIEKLEHQKSELLYSTYQSGAVIEPIPGAIELITALKSSRDFYLNVVTASTRKCMEHVIGVLKLGNNFDDLVSIYDIDSKTGRPFTGKGEPDVYQNLTEKYGVGNNFVMIEDGATGMNGTIKAGGKAIAILGNNPKEKFPQAVSHHHDLKTLSVEEIEKVVDL